MTILYHYCNAETLIKIIQSKMLWLSSTSKMNDLNEGSVVEKRLLRLTNERLSTESHEFLVRTIDMLKDESYACCFSSKPDLAVQWMAYADAGRGFSIGFDSEKLLAVDDRLREMTRDDYFAESRARVIQGDIKLGPVVYFDNDAEQRIVAALNRILRIFDADVLQGQAVMQLRSVDNEILLSAALTCIWLDAVTKDEAFEHEKEYRLFHVPPVLPLERTIAGERLRESVLDPLRWRASRFGLAPFYEYKFNLDAISEIWVGPRNPDHPNVGAQHLIEMFLAHSGMTDVEVKMSTSPYRG
ncbi:DUF2971 domain-containing protein [Caballeronia cordobensis]|uniref:DUF2971 domain-containing protein n=1 Tax=Caballeronia cordobensis TaxID=1353886 RepID=UPI00045EED49|nr:uncharacterized protein BRPE67_FCDS01410 [Burkholderia sp. RPE67]